MSTNISEKALIELLKRETPKEFDQIKLVYEHRKKVSRYVCLKYKAVELIPEFKKITSPVSSDIEKELTSFMSSEGLITTESLDFKKKLKRYGNYKTMDKKFLDELSFEKDIEDEISNIKKNKQGYIHIINDSIEINECDICAGKKYIACKNELCKGNGHYSCPKCNGEKKCECEACHSKGELYCGDCKNTRYMDCGDCNGTGSTISGGVKEACHKCHRTGRVKCESCEDVEAGGKCPICNGKILVECDVCSASGTVECEMCFSKGPYKSLMPCDGCDGEGKMASYDSIEFKVKDKRITSIFCLDEEFWEIDAQDVEKTAKKMKPTVLELGSKKDAESVKDLPNDITEKIEKIREQFKIVKHRGIMSEEIIEYSMIPCLSVPYNHIISGIKSDIFVLGEGHNVRVKYTRDPTKVKIGLNLESVKRNKILEIASKLFSDSNSQKNVDNRSELILYIYLMKADGVIDEKEKEFLVDRIHTTTTFSIDDKRLFFQLLNSQELPKINNNYVVFSSRDKAAEVIYNLKKMALSDGDMAPSEEAIIKELERIYIGN